jgi:hypothetical protein
VELNRTFLHVKAYEFLVFNSVREHLHSSEQVLHPGAMLVLTWKQLLHEYPVSLSVFVFVMTE